MRGPLLRSWIAACLLALPAAGCSTVEKVDEESDRGHEDDADHGDDGEHGEDDYEDDHAEDDESGGRIDAGKKPDAGAKPDAGGPKSDAGSAKPDASTRTDASTPPARSDGGTTPGSDAGGTRGDAGTGPATDAGTTRPDAGSSAGGKLPPVTSVDANGPFETVIEMNVGPNRGWVVRPKDLGKDGLKHPIFTWGAGAGTNASNYRDHLTRIASHGFVVEGHASNGNGSDHRGAIDWLVKQNDDASSPYYQKLDTTKIASGGHSQGSISTFAMADDPRLSTTIHVAGGSFDGNGSNKLRKPAAMILGKNDTLATGYGERDYMRSQVPTFLTVMDGVDHIMAARQGLAPIVAWLRWHLGGEEERKAQFVGASCEFCQGKFKSQSKGF